MSFTTGRAQRRGIKSSSQGTSLSHISRVPYPLADLIKQTPGPDRASAKRRRTASIGDDRATGLNIVGTHEFDPMEGTDPDGAVPPVSGNTLSNPDFPVSYTGRGTLKFVSPIRISSIEGPVNVLGDVYASGDYYTGGTILTGGGGGPGDTVALWTPTVGATGGGLNFTTDAANTWATYAKSQDHITIHLHFAWSDKGTVGAGSSLFIKGLPFPLETQVHKVVIHSTGIVATQIGSYFVADGAVDASQLAILTADSATGTEVVVTPTECGTTGTISCILSYHAVI